LPVEREFRHFNTLISEKRRLPHKDFIKKTNIFLQFVGVCVLLLLDICRCFEHEALRPTAL